MWNTLQQRNTWGKLINGWLGSAPLALHQTTIAIPSQDQVLVYQGTSQEWTLLDIHVSHPSFGSSCSPVSAAWVFGYHCFVWVFGSRQIHKLLCILWCPEQEMILILVLHIENSTSQGPSHFPCSHLFYFFFRVQKYPSSPKLTLSFHIIIMIIMPQIFAKLPWCLFYLIE
jgi:hypothetical protein